MRTQVDFDGILELVRTLVPGRDPDRGDMEIFALVDFVELPDGDDMPLDHDVTLVCAFSFCPEGFICRRERGQ